MPASFDAYQKWLGIPPEQQPPNPYRLLGIELFESDRDTIDNAADRQMAHVRSFQSGQYSELSQKLLNEISDARVKLLSPQHKAVIDSHLRARRAAPVARPLAVAQAPPPAGAVVQGPPAPGPGPLVDTSEERVQRIAKRKKTGGPLLIAQVVGGGVLAVTIVMLVPWWVFGADPFGLAGVLPDAVSFLAPASLREADPAPAPPPPEGGGPVKPPNGGNTPPAEKNPFENVISENQLSPQARGVSGLNSDQNDPFKLPGAPN